MPISSNHETQILIVDDEPGMRDMLTILLKKQGYTVTSAAGFARGKEAIQLSEPFAVMITDLVMPDGNGLDLLSFAKEKQSATEVIVMTAHGAMDVAIEAMKRGAYDFVGKPFQAAEMRLLVQRALEKSSIVRENVRLKAQLEQRASPLTFLGKSESMRAIADVISRVASTRATVLITGESGTGKERIARAIHECSDRATKPFLVVNCGALPEALMESELFGHEKGAFTGASGRHMGLFREAEGGTLLLDEVGELPLPLQVKLLRAVQERKIRPVGGIAELPVDARVIAATNRDVEKEVNEGRFRQDLYYRLNIIRIEVPPLRKRAEDLPTLIDGFLHRFSEDMGKAIKGLTQEAMRALLSYSFPGNVRELENILERAVTLCPGNVLALGDLPPNLSAGTSAPVASLLSLPEQGCDLEAVIQEAERRLIVQALERSDGVRTQAAKLLGVTFRSLRYRLAKHGLDTGDDDEQELPLSTGKLRSESKK